MVSKTSVNKGKEVAISDKELPIMDELVFLAEPEGEGSRSTRDEHCIRFDKDSYIMCFEGRRGGGKTTIMSLFVVKAVALYNMRVVSNYPVEFMLRRHRPDGKTYLQHVKSEDLDFEKLIMQSDDYQNVLICIDEAPDIISHMASQSWRNRLVAAFTRQIRKNNCTLLLAAQDFDLIDKSMRWQVDVVIECRDAARYIGENSGLDNGEMIWTNWYDNSGQWTGKDTHDRHNNGESGCVMQLEYFPRILWGDATHKAVFDSWWQIDIFDSLRKVDLKMSSIKVGDAQTSDSYDRYPVSSKTLDKALHMINMILEEKPDEPNVYQKFFFESLDGLTDADKNNLGRKLSDYNVERGGEGSKRWYGFGEFNKVLFEDYVKSQHPGQDSDTTKA